MKITRWHMAGGVSSCIADGLPGQVGRYRVDVQESVGAAESDRCTENRFNW